MSSTAVVWFRRDLRLADNPAFAAACRQHVRILPVFIDDTAGEGDWPLGAAARAWQQRSLAALAADMQAHGLRLVLRQGDSLDQLRTLIHESGAAAVYWNRRYEPAVRQRDERIKSALRDDGVTCDSFNAALLNEPWQVMNGSGEPYRVFTPYWRRAAAVLDTLPPPVPSPPRATRVEGIASAELDSLLPAPRPAWDAGFWDCHTPGERGAMRRLLDFLEAIARYEQGRDQLAESATSALSPHLAFGEISSRQIASAIVDAGLRSVAAPFLRQLGWREFAYHLLFHFPDSTDRDLTAQMAGFEWAVPEAADLAAWQQGRTGIPVIDAGMRELWQTGVMHNRARMLVASLLCKNLRYHWTIGARWFWDTLIDADLANNTLGWQWCAGTGADAAPYFRIFNPVTQGQRFDPDGAYVRRFVAELADAPARWIHTPWLAPPAQRRRTYPPSPIVDLAATRNAAMQAWKQRRG